MDSSNVSELYVKQSFIERLIKDYFNDNQHTSVKGIEWGFDRKKKVQLKLSLKRRV